LDASGGGVFLNLNDPEEGALTRAAASTQPFDAMSNESHIGDLIAEITVAFDSVAREDGTTLHQAIAIDDWKTAEEQLAAR